MRQYGETLGTEQRDKGTIPLAHPPAPSPRLPRAFPVAATRQPEPVGIASPIGPPAFWPRPTTALSPED
ncbi:hypothetical protein GCM10012284_23660 [Mangrovihabitans endophyticus]|uniref:Uncharacterized protein n=1 Tax=Mangrovihabitans endophyticus TaxID=1751298 RepID=A0A8J3FN20_9ACTN|nr:hypothetical protein GCM10012284_23660 [Mangrovihabitans endophyticus]